MKKTIKLLGLALLLSPVFVSCGPKEDEPQTPEVSVTVQHYNLGKDAIDVTVKSSVAPTTDLIIPFTVTGDAQEGSDKDFVLSAQQFVIKAGETLGTVTVSHGSAPQADDTRTLTLNLGAGTGYNLGLAKFCTIDLLGKNGYIVSFANNTLKLVDEGELLIETSKMDGSNYNLPAADSFEVEVDPDRSTAVEGVHYSFPDGKSIDVPAKKFKGSVKIKLLSVEAGKDVVVIRLKEKAGFATGTNPTMEIRLAGVESIAGTWAFGEFVEMETLTGYGESLSQAPKATSADKFTLAGGTAEYTFTPSFSGDLKNYFGNSERKITLLGIKSKLFGQTTISPFFVRIPTYTFPGINVNFSANATKTRDAKVAMRLIDVDGQEVLEMTIDDWEPLEHEFCGQAYSWMKDYDDGDVAGSEWIPLRLHFTRAK